MTQTILDRIRDGIQNGWIGRRLSTLFHDCGIERVRIKAVPIVIRDFRAADTLLDLTIIAGRAVEEGLLGEREAMTWLNELDARDKAGIFFATLVMFILTGRKPGRT